MANSFLNQFTRCLSNLLWGYKRRLLFTKISVEGIEIKGRINMVKMEPGQSVTFTAEPEDRRGKPAKIEVGSAEWSFVGQDADGNDASSSVTVTENPDNELSATLTSGDTELTGTLTLRADGDPNQDETVEVIATASIIVAPGNVVAFALTNTEPVDV